MPKRIQMTRRKGGWRDQHPDAVVVARPSKWGNPFVVGKECFVCGVVGRVLVRDKSHAVELYRNHVCHYVGGYLFRETVMKELRGKDLACWCPPDQPCHADVLLEVANA